jgi:hypothetical protein
MIAFGAVAATGVSLPLAACSSDSSGPSGDAGHYAVDAAYGGFAVDATSGAAYGGMPAYGAIAVDAGDDGASDDSGNVDEASSDSGDAGDQ